MTQTELLEAVVRLVKKQVAKELEKQRDVIRMEIIGEVAGMLNYSERKLLTRINEMQSHNTPKRESAGGGDFDRTMRNLKTMAGFDHITERVAQPQRPRQSKYTDDSLLNDILNETSPFTKGEVRDTDSGFDSLLDFSGVGGGLEEPWETNHNIEVDDFGDDEFAPSSFTPPIVPSTLSTNYGPQTIMGTDMKPVDVKNPTVQKVLEIMNGTDYKAKLDAMNEAGEQFRGGAAPAPKYNSQYFQKQMVD